MMIDIEKIEKMMSECVTYSTDTNLLLVDDNAASTFINENNISNENLIVVKKIIKLLNNNRQLSDLEISELIERVNLI